MEFIALLKGIVIGLVASIPLGPIGVMCIQRTLSKSHRSGFISGLGAATADSLFATVALFSLTVVMSFIENYIAIIKALGGISVIIVGMAIFLKNPLCRFAVTGPVREVFGAITFPCFSSRWPIPRLS